MDIEETPAKYFAPKFLLRAVTVEMTDVGAGKPAKLFGLRMIIPKIRT